MTEPNKDVLRLWAEDLETTTDRQGNGYLAAITKEYQGVPASTSYCCLGRLCKLAAENGVIGEPRAANEESDAVTEVLEYGDWDRTSSNPEFEGRDTSHLVLPDVVKEWAGLEDNDPVLVSHIRAESVTASALNDSHGYTFKEIAAAIREKFDL